jgi:predicted TPR repeat methyltransferase
VTSAQTQSREIFVIGIGHFEAGRWNEARDCFERCRALTPERPSVLGNLGITLHRLGHTREALPLLQQATAGEPQFMEAWACLGLAHEAHGEWAPAADALTKALALSDGSAALWLSLGQCRARLGRHAQALQALDRALAIEPEHATAWSLRGGLLREMLKPDAAAHSFERAIALGADRELHTYYLASVRAGVAPPPAAPRQYVEALFDDYAADFERHLVNTLDYRAHELLLAPLIGREAPHRRFRAVLDLGCGTGLCAPLLKDHCNAIDGVDLSAEMLKQAAKLGIYRELVHADITAHLSTTPLHPDLVVAADVLIYVGDASAVFAHVARILDADGLFAFTVELPPSNGAELQLLPSLRYAHSQAYVQRLAVEHGFEVAHLQAAPIRHEQGTPVPGLYVHLRQSRSQAG